MPSRRTFSLGSHFDGVIDSQLAAGRFDNASEVVRAGLRLLEDYEARMSRLRQDISKADAQFTNGEGIAVSDSRAFANDIVGRGRARLNQEQ